MLRWIGYSVVGVVAVLAVGAGAVFAVDAWRAARAVPPDCDSDSFDLYSVRGDLLDDGGVRSRAWAALNDRDLPEVDMELLGSRPELSRSCVVFAGNTPAGTTVVFVERTRAARYQSVVGISEVRLLPDTDRIQAANVWHTLPLGSEMRSGMLLPLSGFYLAPEDAETVTVLSAADGFAEARQAPAIGDGLFDVGVAPDLTRDRAERVDFDAMLLVEQDDGGFPIGIALPASSPLEIPEGVRASFQLGVERGSTIDLALLRTVGPAVSALRSDPVYALIRDYARRPSLGVTVGPDGVTLTPLRDGTTVLPSFTLPNAGN